MYESHDGAGQIVCHGDGQCGKRQQAQQYDGQTSLQQLTLFVGQFDFVELHKDMANDFWRNGFTAAIPLKKGIGLVQRTFDGGTKSDPLISFANPSRFAQGSPQLFCGK